jgi:hypothetical protein
VFYVDNLKGDGLSRGLTVRKNGSRLNVQHFTPGESALPQVKSAITSLVTRQREKLEAGGQNEKFTVARRHRQQARRCAPQTKRASGLFKSKAQRPTRQARWEQDR